MATEKTTKKPPVEEKVVTEEVVEAPVATEPVAEERAVAETTEQRNETDRMGMMWAFVAVAAFVGLVGGFFCGFVAGRLSVYSHDGMMQGPSMYEQRNDGRQPYWSDGSYGL